MYCCAGSGLVHETIGEGEVVSSEYSVDFFIPMPINLCNLAARLILLLQVPISACPSLLVNYPDIELQKSWQNLKEKLAAKRSVIRAVYERAGCDRCSTEKPGTKTKSHLSLYIILVLQRRPFTTEEGSGTRPLPELFFSPKILGNLNIHHCGLHAPTLLQA